MTDGWKPRRGAVALTQLDDGSWQVDCHDCGYHWPEPQWKGSRTDATERKSSHRCPPGTPGATAPRSLT